MIKVGMVLLKLLPIASGIVRAMRKDSPGGKKITVEELMEIFLKNIDTLEEDLNKLE